MRTILGLVFIALAAALALNGAKSLALSEHPSAAYLAGELIGAFFIPIVLGVVGMRWLRPSKASVQ